MPDDAGFSAEFRKKDRAAPIDGRLTIINPCSLLHVPVPQRVWIVEDWLPAGHVTLSYGDGGVGKTLLAQQLMTSCATGALWIGLQVTRCRSFGIFCEDHADEVHRRQDRINGALGVGYDDLGDMRWTCPVGQDNALIRFEPDGYHSPTPRFIELGKEAMAFGAKLVVVDTAADTFSGNENDRRQVRLFLSTMLTKLAIEIKGAVLLNAHPSRSGLSTTGDMDGGSTGWSNTARSRWALARPATEDGDVPDANARILTRRKANYASIGDQIRLQWRDGALMPQSGGTGATGAPARAAIEEMFLTLLDRCMAQGQPVSPSPNAGNFAPKVFATRPDRSGYARKDFNTAMQALFAAQRIRVEEYGRSGKWRSRIARDQRYGEPEA